MGVTQQLCLEFLRSEVTAVFMIWKVMDWQNVTRKYPTTNDLHNFMPRLVYWEPGPQWNKHVEALSMGPDLMFCRWYCFLLYRKERDIK